MPTNSSTVKNIDSVWTYTTDTGRKGTLTLPAVLSLPDGTGEIRLTATLPEWTGEAYVLQFVSIEKTVEVWINGEKRYTYGTSPEAPDFVYRSAHHINQVVLEQEDSGGEIVLIYQAPPLFRPELGLLRDMKIGTMNDLTLSLFGRSIPCMIVCFFAILTTLLSLVLLITYRGMPLRENLSVLLLAVVAAVFLNSENSALWSVFHHSPILSALVDWIFYYVDPLVQFTAWLVLFVTGWRLRGIWLWMSFFLGGYSAMTVLSLAGFLNFNLTRPFFSVAGFFFTVFWIKNHTRSCRKEHMGFSTAVLILLAGYYLDYIKYLLALLPMSAKWFVQRDVSLRSIKHDMQFHFRTASALLSEGKTEEAERYLADLGDTVAAMRISSWCTDYVANITIGWYADQFSQQGIPFSVMAAIPALRADVHVDISCILSNALQNALEGCAGQEEPFVRLSAKPKGNNLLLRIENRCRRELSALQDFPTTKRGEGHGLGIAGMKAAAKRHNGYVETCAKEGVFLVDVVLCDVFASSKE